MQSRVFHPQIQRIEHEDMIIIHLENMPGEAFSRNMPPAKLFYSMELCGNNQYLPTCNKFEILSESLKDLHT